MKISRVYQGIYVLLLIAFVLYGWAFIQRTSVVVDGQRIQALFDDAMISMQYAKNLAHGAGLVWNVGGERVEGFSNPLWVLLMAGIHLFPIPLTETSFYVKLMSLGFLLINLLVVKLLVEEFTESKAVPMIAVFLTAFYFPLNNWSLQGMEVGLEALLINAALLTGIRGMRKKRVRPWTYVLLGISVWLRMDAAAPALAATAAFAWIDHKHRRQHLAWGFGAVGLMLLALTIFRLAYYGEWLPNTYYLKLGTGSAVLRLSIGLRRLWDFVWNSNWVLFALPLMLPVLDKRRTLWPLYAAFIAVVGYSVYVGGDSWEQVGGANRFIAAVMPLFFVAFVLTLSHMADLTLAITKTKTWWSLVAVQVSIALFAIFSLFSFNSLLVQDAFAKWTLIEKPVFTESVERYAGMGIELGKITTSNATIAVVTAGNIPYFAGRTSIDLLGKNDKVIAREPARLNSSLFEPGNYRPGHNKWDYAYSLGELKPDVVAQIWEGTDDEAAPYLVDYRPYVINGIPYYFRKDSPNILWDQLPTQN